MASELVVSIISLLSLIFFIGLVCYVATQILIKRLKSRPDGIAYIRDYKLGKCGIVFLPAFLLYFVGLYGSDDSFLDTLFCTIEKTMKLVTLNYDIKDIESMMKAYPIYHTAIQVCFLVVLLNALLFVLSLISQGIWYLWQQMKAACTRKNRLILIGNNQENRAIYESDTIRHAIILEETASVDRKQLPQDKDLLYMRNIPYHYVHALKNELEKVLKAANRRKKEWVLVINTLDDTRNISLCTEIVDMIQRFPSESQDNIYLKLKIFVFGDPQYEAVYGDISCRSHGCIHYINKHQRIAMDFIDRYPFTKFMDENQIDYATSLIKEDVDINAIFLGFGKTNRQIFLTSVANNQFMTGSAKAPTIKPVNYHIFDKDPAENNKNLNHTYYRFQNECFDKDGTLNLDPQAYLPMPDFPAEEHYHHQDVNLKDFYAKIQQIVTANPKAVHFMVIAFGNDLENLDMAQKMIEKRREWDIANLAIFVKVRFWHKEQTLLKDECCYFIGHEQDVVFNIEKIIANDLYRMAQLRNEVYDLEYKVVNEPGFVLNEESIANNSADALRSWYQEKTALQRESSLYCCLSLRSKLNLMGLDYCKKATPDDRGMDEQAYLACYAGNDLPDTQYYNKKANEKSIIHYSLDFQDSRRTTMAIHEHQRWNAFMISKGIIPASIQQILTEKNKKGKFSNGNNGILRHHGNLTTYEGLSQFRKLVAKRDNATEEAKDVFKYDYQLLDDAHWLLDKSDYKLIPHTKLS